jgi:YVTN family beta-propeller protein
VSTDQSKLYILRRTGNAVSILNTTTDTVIQTLNFGKEPYISVPYGRRLYVIFYTGAKHIEVIDTTSELQCS